MGLLFQVIQYVIADTVKNIPQTIFHLSVYLIYVPTGSQDLSLHSCFTFASYWEPGSSRPFPSLRSRRAKAPDPISPAQCNVPGYYAKPDSQHATGLFDCPKLRLIAWQRRVKGTLKRLKQGDCCEYVCFLIYAVSSRTPKTMVSKNKQANKTSTPKPEEPIKKEIPLFQSCGEMHIPQNSVG